MTVSCYCEPVWWSPLRRFWTNKISRCIVSASQPEREKGADHRGLRDSLEGAGWLAMTAETQ